MAEITKNKLSARLIKAEMLNDQASVIKLKEELAKLSSSSTYDKSIPSQGNSSCRSFEDGNKSQTKRTGPQRNIDNRVKKFIQSNASLGQMFAPEAHLTASDEAKMFMKTSSKFSKEDMETKYFSEEIDDSQKILNKRHKSEPVRGKVNRNSDQQLCSQCYDKRPKHLVVESNFSCIYMTLMSAKPIFSTMSNVIILNNDHSCSSFVAASEEHQEKVEILTESLREAWKSKGYNCLIMETYYRNHKGNNREFVSCNNHFQIHCLPIREKHFEKTRMCFKQALQATGNDWSMNRKIIKADGSRIQRYLPKGLPYFWVCFDTLKSGFGHVIESEQEFSRFFGFDVISGALGREFNQMKLNENESFNEQFERSRDFKLLYSNFRQAK